MADLDRTKVLVDHKTLSEGRGMPDIYCQLDFIQIEIAFYLLEHKTDAPVGLFEPMQLCKFVSHVMMP